MIFTLLINTLVLIKYTAQHDPWEISRIILTTLKILQKYILLYADNCLTYKGNSIINFKNIALAKLKLHIQQTCFI